MKAKKIKAFMAAALAVCMVASMTGCGKSKVALNDGEFQEVDKAELEFPLKEKTEISGIQAIRQTQSLTRIREPSSNVFRKKQMLK